MVKPPASRAARSQSGHLKATAQPEPAFGTDDMSRRMASQSLERILKSKAALRRSATPKPAKGV
jgi:hypothetical protein